MLYFSYSLSIHSHHSALHGNCGGYCDQIDPPCFLPLSYLTNKVKPVNLINLLNLISFAQHSIGFVDSKSDVSHSNLLSWYSCVATVSQVS